MTNNADCIFIPGFYILSCNEFNRRRALELYVAFCIIVKTPLLPDLTVRDRTFVCLQISEEIVKTCKIDRERIGIVSQLVVLDIWVYFKTVRTLYIVELHRRTRDEMPWNLKGGVVVFSAKQRVRYYGSVAITMLDIKLIV